MLGINTYIRYNAIIIHIHYNCYYHYFYYYYYANTVYNFNFNIYSRCVNIKLITIKISIIIIFIIVVIIIYINVHTITTLIVPNIVRSVERRVYMYTYREIEIASVIIDFPTRSNSRSAVSMSVRVAPYFRLLYYGDEQIHEWRLAA